VTHQVELYVIKRLTLCEVVVVGHHQQAALVAAHDGLCVALGLMSAAQTNARAGGMVEVSTLLLHAALPMALLAHPAAFSCRAGRATQVGFTALPCWLCSTHACRLIAAPAATHTQHAASGNTPRYPSFMLK
jgi:hypothetical protein